jgi:quercetin dioxygenase-like cupin family protein
MHRAAALISLTFALGFHAVASAQPAQQAQMPSIEVDFDHVQWVALNQTEPKVYTATLKVDESTGATQMLWKFPPNAIGPCHWHSSNESNIVVKGSITMRHMGTAGGTLGVGGFSYVPKKMNHQLTTGPTETVVFSSLDGRFDLNIVSPSACAAPSK